MILAGAVLAGCISLVDMEPNIELPDDPVERAAIQGLIHTYKESTMWQINAAEVVKVQPMVPTKAFVQQHDPKELYCVCVKYQARYKVPWTTKDRSPWEPSIRNILVMKTQADQFMAVRPAAICPAFCQ
jgi:hypothetical protein